MMADRLPAETCVACGGPIAVKEPRAGSRESGRWWHVREPCVKEWATDFVGRLKE